MPTTFPQAQAFFTYLCGTKPIGATPTEAFKVPYSPELQAFLEGLLLAGPTFSRGHSPSTAERRQAMTNAIRDLCDAFDRGPEIKPRSEPRQEPQS